MSIENTDTRGGNRQVVGLTISIYIVWVIATWLLEGRIHTLLRPEAADDRLAYALVVNLAVGLVLTLYVLRVLRVRGSVQSRQLGFQSSRHAVLAVGAGAALGAASFAMQRPTTLQPFVLINVFAQVLVVSAAEVVVCWAAVGSAIAAAAERRGRWGVVLGALSASVLFGVYHFAHSPPFNSMSMVLMLSVVGLVTSTFFFVSRDLYGTIVFHNFLAMTGVTKALDAGDRVTSYEGLQLPLVAVASVSMLVLVVAHSLWFRGEPGTSAVGD